MFQRRKKIKTLYFVTFGGVIFFIIHRFLFSHFSFINTASSLISYPVLVAQKYVVAPVQLFFKRRKKNVQLTKEVQTLRAEIQKLTAENIELKSQLNYYSDIKELVQFKKRYNKNNGITAQVLLKKLSSQSHIFFIDKGSRYDIEKDMVVVFKNCLVGKVTEVFPFYSKVLLVTDKKCKVAGVCSKTKATGIHVGTNSFDATDLQRISHLSSMKEGDVVISSGDGLIFPQGFALGKVKKATVDGLYFSVIVEPLIDVRDIRYCVVLQKGESSSKV